MQQSLFEHLASIVAQTSRPSGTQKLDALIGLLHTLCTREGISERILKPAVGLIVAESYGHKPESLLRDIPSDIAQEEVEQSHRLYLAYKHDMPSDRRDLQVLSDLFLLEQIGATRLEQVFREWDGLDSVELYEEVNRAYQHAQSLFNGLQTKSARDVALDRLQMMQTYCTRIREEMQPVLDHRRKANE